MAYTHLTYEERYSLWSLKRAGLSIRRTAMILDRSPSSVSRELRRNSGGRAYRARRAQTLADARRRIPVTWKFKGDLVKQVEGLLRQQWSPEQISGWLKAHGLASVSHERIYQHVYEDAARGGDLWHNLRRIRRRRRHKRGLGRGRHTKLRGHRLIDVRPEVVDKRARFGDWEGDTMVGKGQKGYLVTLVERRSRLVLAGKSETRRSKEITRIIAELFSGFPPTLKRTLTLDNGTEFVRHKQIEKATGLDVYFAHPYRSWERGANENANGLLRQYLPKRTDFRKVRSGHVMTAVARLNGRPRKKLGFASPAEFIQTHVDGWPPGKELPASLRSALGPSGRPFGDGRHFTTPGKSGGTSEASSKKQGYERESNKNTGVALVT